MQQNITTDTYELLKSISRLTLGLAIVVLLNGCHGATKNKDMEINRPPIEVPTPNNFQELGFFGPIKESMWLDFVAAVQDNVANSRKEPGNIAFSLYQPEDGSLEPIWFERFDSKAAHNFHKDQEHFKNAIAVIQRSLAGDAKAITLRTMDELPVIDPIKATESGLSRYIVTIYAVQPENRLQFIDAVVLLGFKARNEEGNIEFNPYVNIEDPNVFVIMEGWETKADHESFMEQKAINAFRTSTQGIFVGDPSATRWVLKDISI